MRCGCVICRGWRSGAPPIGTRGLGLVVRGGLDESEVSGGPGGRAVPGSGRLGEGRGGDDGAHGTRADDPLAAGQRRPGLRRELAAEGRTGRR